MEESIGQAAAQIANDIKADCIISLSREEVDVLEQDPLWMDITVTFFRQVKKGVYSKLQYSTKIRKAESSSIIPIKEVLMEGINKKYITQGEKIVCVTGESMGTGYKGMLFIFDVDKLFFDISQHLSVQHINADAIEATIKIAQEIAREGREGKKVGTAFIIGDRNKLTPYLRQLFINPFRGYPEQMRRITDPAIKETVKEFAQLEGAFAIDSEGIILTCGAYININSDGMNLPLGFGTRHRSCAALTQEVDAIAVVVSASGGTVRVFKNGKPIIKLDPDA